MVSNGLIPLLVIDQIRSLHGCFRAFDWKDQGVELVDCVCFADEVIHLLEKNCRPMVVLFDFLQEECGGLSSIKTISEKQGQCIVWSKVNTSFIARIVFNAGAKGKISKYDSVERIGEAVRVVGRGDPFCQDLELRQLFAELNEDVNPLTRLSARELQVFHLLGKAQSTKEIAARLNLSGKTIEAHVERVKSKLYIKNRNSLLYFYWLLSRLGLTRETDVPAILGMR